MHGIIFIALKNYVVDNLDKQTWRAMVDGVEPENPMYVPVTTYPDEDLLAYVELAVETTGIDVDHLIRDFGSYIVPPLAETYGPFIDDDWDGLDLVANTEQTIHESLRARQADFTPPELETTRIDEDRVQVAYTSDRQLCELAKGIVDGLGDHYDEELVVEEPTCMKEGNPQCLMEITRVKADSSDVETVEATGNPDRQNFEDAVSEEDGDDDPEVPESDAPTLFHSIRSYLE